MAPSSARQTFSQIVTLNVIASPQPGGTATLDPPSGAYPFGTVVTLTAVPAASFTFSGWTGDLSDTVNPIALTVNASKTVTARFSEVS
jgi:uncharacterized repeat protein (TIGR02543 family)